MSISLATYPTLYSRDSKGKIRIWYMQQDLHKYRTVSGLQDGEKVTSEWTEAEPKNQGKKNETTAINQATEEVRAKYKKQKKTGYFHKVQDVDSFQYVEAQLAKQYKDYALDFTKNEWAIQRKLNGNRCIATRYGLFTRKGERYISVPHIEEALEVYFEANPDAVLDGEIYNYDLRQRLNELSSLVRKTKNITQEDLDKSAKICEFWIYDGYGFAGTSETTKYSDRFKYITLLKEYFKLTPIKILPYTILTSEEQFNQLYNKFIEDGEEGAILRKLDSPYEHKRSKNLLKVKPEDSETGTVLDIMEGEGNWSHTGKVWRLSWEGKEFNATLKGSYEEGVQVLKDKSKWIGRKVTFLFNGLTGLSTPNFARVDILNCEPST